MLENWKTLATWNPQPIATAKLGTSTIVADYSQGATQYTQVSNGTKKKVSFADIVTYAATLGDTAVKVISALKSPTASSSGVDLTGLSLDDRKAIVDLQTDAQATLKRRQRNVLIAVAAGLLVLVTVGFYLKSKN